MRQSQLQGVFPEFVVHSTESLDVLSQGFFLLLWKDLQGIGLSCLLVATYEGIKKLIAQVSP